MARKRKTKGVVQHNKRVRFCTLDYYRTLVTGISSEIEGIKQYYCDSNKICIYFDNGYHNEYDITFGEIQLKQVVKEINAYLGGKI